MTRKHKDPNSSKPVPQDLIQAVFTLSRLWERVFDRAFQPDGISVKQFFLMAVIDRDFESPPALGDAAEVLKMSYQNVKKLALQLENRGMLELRQDESDRRILRLLKTPANEEYWKNRTPGDTESFNALFYNVSIADMKTTLSTISRLAGNAETTAGDIH